MDLSPVCDGNKLRGTLTDRDITVRGIAEGYDPSKTKVADIMSTDLACCYEDDDIDAAMDLMEKRQIRRLPVISREKRLVGIVSFGQHRKKGASRRDARRSFPTDIA